MISMVYFNWGVMWVYLTYLGITGLCVPAVLPQASPPPPPANAGLCAFSAPWYIIA